MTLSHRWVCLFGTALVLLSSCYSSPPTPPAAISVLEQSFHAPTLYMTEKGEEFVGAGETRGVTVHKASGQLAWEAWQCGNPECPGEKKEGRPFLFIWPNPCLLSDGAGGIKSVQPESEADLAKYREWGEIKCPACLKNRNIESETAEQRQKYKDFCTKYELPEAKAARDLAAKKFREQIGAKAPPTAPPKSK